MSRVYHESSGGKVLRGNVGLISSSVSGGMAFDPGAISSTLAAAVGDEPALIAELRLAFVESAGRVTAVLAAADDGKSWLPAASRLRGLAASFGAVRLMALAEQAIAAGAPDAALLRKITRVVDRLAALP